MCSAANLSYRELMDLPIDEFLEVRSVVVKIGEEQNRRIEKAKRG